MSTSENALLENALKTHLGLTVKFKVEKHDETVECGISARYTSDLLDMVIFNFTDKNLHNNQNPLALIYESTVREILTQDVRSVLRELPSDAVVFVLSDHGFSPVSKTPFTVPSGLIMDNADVKYRVGRLKAPLEGEDAKNGVMFKVGDLGIPNKIRKPNGAEWSFNHVLFPRPGVTLKRPQGPFSPDRYTHGGLSMAECLIPLVVLGQKVAFELPFELTGLRFEGPLTENQPIDILIQAKAKASLQEEVLFVLQVEAGQDTIQPRKEVFDGVEHEFKIRWTPKVNALHRQSRAGKLVKQVTAVASFRWKNRTVRSSVHGKVEIVLDTSRVRRRLDSKLDSIMGMVPAVFR